MDPLTHTLLGSQLAASGLGRSSALATTTLLLAVNLPDIDFVTYFIDADLALEVRRGITHGIFAMVVLPLGLTLGICLFYLLRRRWRARGGTTSKVPPGGAADAPAFRPLAILALASVGVLSHPLLDWLNTYGVRLLAPRKERWFYGDTLFIIDPWIWMVLGGAAWLRYGRTRRGRILCAIVGLMMALAVVIGSPSPLGSGLWLVALVAVLASSRLPALQTWAANGRLAIVAILLTTCYVLLLMAADNAAEQQIRRRLAAEDTPINGMMVGPTPINPLRRDVIVRSGDRYTFGTFNWLASPHFTITDTSTRLPGPEPRVVAALAAPCVRGMLGWMRYPIVEVEPLDRGHRAHIFDARYARPPSRGFGTARVELDENLEASCPTP